MKVLLSNKLIALFCIIVVNIASAQLVNVNNVHFHVSPGATVQINGDAATAGSTFYNLGTVQIAGSYVNNGVTCGGDNASNGAFVLSNDWINNGTFVPKLGLVRLNGADQHIGGTQVTSFNNLDLTGTGKKIQDIDVNVINTLALNNIELATESHAMAILNADPNAITRINGFVSSLSGGFLSRNMIMKSQYLFPVGSTLGTTRYRPVGLQPYNVPSGTSTYSVRMVNNIATADGYDVDKNDDDVCFTNQQYYHLIAQTSGAEPANVVIQYDNAQDSSHWNMISYWGAAATQWTNTGTNIEHDKLQYNYVANAGVNIVKIPNGWNKLTNVLTPYILAYRRPKLTNLECTSELCYGDTARIYNLAGNTTPGSYVWTVTGGTITGSSNTQNIKVNWNAAGTGNVAIYENIVGRCNSDTLDCDVTIHPKPVATVVTDSNNVFEYDLIHFTDPTNPNCNFTWDFGDGHQNTLNEPYHKYTHPDTYHVVHMVETVYGCRDTAEFDMHIVKGVITGNVFTPNGDGYNDEFIIKNSGMGTYSLAIYDRWGGLVFESLSPHVGWDGKTRSGTEAAAGTYYYLFTGTIDDKKYDEKGVITLVRGKK